MRELRYCQCGKVYIELFAYTAAFLWHLQQPSCLMFFMYLCIEMSWSMSVISLWVYVAGCIVCVSFPVVHVLAGIWCECNSKFCWGCLLAMLANVQGLWTVICEQVVPHWLVFSIFEMALSLCLPVFVIAMIESVLLCLNVFPNSEFCAKTLS